MSDPVWDRIDKHAEYISALQQNQAATDARVTAMDQRIDRQHAHLIESLARMEGKIDTQGQWINESQGGLKLGRWLAGIGLAILGAAVAFLKYFKS